MWWRHIIACLTTYANALVSTSSIIKRGYSPSLQDSHRDKVMHAAEILSMVKEAMQNSTGVLLWVVQAALAPQ